MESKFTKYLIAIIILIGASFRSYGQSESISAGSIIVNMGSTTPTIATGLKPYGMVYDLVQNYNVPVKWVINASKAKDGVDFSHNGKTFKGGPFIIPAEFRTTAVNSRINYWKSQGVLVDSTVSSVTVPVYATLTYMPRWVLDAQNTSIAEKYLTNASIPATAYKTLQPSQLSTSNDIYVMPHADPTWAVHQYLLNFNKNLKGAIFSGCHAASELENIYNTADTTKRLNFLMTPPTGSNKKSAVYFENHEDAETPGSYRQNYPGDPLMQFMGKTDNASQNGSEQVYLPKTSWRSTTKIGVYDSDHEDIPTLSAGPAAQIAYGQGFGDANAGKVCYFSGHDLAKESGAEFVCAQRVFFNFSLWTARDKALTTSISGSSNYLRHNTAQALTGAASGGAGSYSYQWLSNVGGTFSNPNGTSTTFTPSTVSGNLPAYVEFIVTDSSGRKSFSYFITTIIPNPRKPIAIDDQDSLPNTCAVGSFYTKNVLLNDYDLDGDMGTEIALIGSGTNGTFENLGSGIIKFTPSLNFSGVAYIDYLICDNTPTTALCDTGRFSIYVGGVDAHGCLSNQFYGVERTSYGDTAVTQFNILNPLNARYAPDGNFAELDNVSDVLTIRMSDTLIAGDTLTFIWKSGSGTSTMTIEPSLNNSTFGTASSFSTASTSYIITKYIVPSGGTYYIRIKRTANKPQLDALAAYHYNCVSKSPKLVTTNMSIVEDSGTSVSVLSGCTDPQGLNLSVRKITVSPLNGYVSINIDGSITYEPNRDFSGVDSFQYRICNSEGYCSDAWLKVTIKDDGCSAGGFKPVDSTTVSKSWAATIDNGILENFATTNYGNSDSIGVGFKIPNRARTFVQFDSVSAIPSNATLLSANLQLYQLNGKFSQALYVYPLSESWSESGSTWNKRNSTTNWTSAGGSYHLDSVSFTTASSAQYNSVNVFSMVNSWFTGSRTNNGFLLKRAGENASNNDAVLLASSEYSSGSYTPKLELTYRIPLTCRTIVGHAPLAMLDYDTTNSTTSKNVSVLSNDSDVDPGSSFSLTGVFGAIGGSATVSGSQVVFTPTYGFNGEASFKYIITDNAGAKDTAIAYITVTNSNPVANWDTASVSSGAQVTINVLNNDTDPEGSAFTAPKICKDPNNGVVTISGNNLVYTSITSFSGYDTIIYLATELSANACSKVALSDTAIVIVRVINRAPIAVNDTITVNQCTPTYISVMANDTDAEQGFLSISLANSPSKGSAFINDGEIVYQSYPNSTGTDTVRYSICDDGIPSKCSSALLVIHINSSAVNNKPIANNDYDTTHIKGFAYIDILDNDSDPDNDLLEASISTGILQPSHGKISVFNKKMIRYIPSRYSNYTGIDSFEYIICDVHPSASAGCNVAAIKCDTAKVYIYLSDDPTLYMIQGLVSNDTNGLTDNFINEDGISALAGQQLYVNLIDSNNKVAASMPVSANGDFSFDKIIAGEFTVQASINQTNVGDTAALAVLPFGWENVGENLGATAGSDGTPDGMLPVSVEGLSLSDANLGLNRKPNTTETTDTIHANPGGANYVAVDSSLFEPIDSGGRITAIKLISFPTNTENIKINSTVYDSTSFPNTGITIPTDANGKPLDSIAINPKNGAIVSHLDYIAIDNAGSESIDTGYVEVPFTLVSISGTVLRDRNGLNNAVIDGSPIGKIGVNQLYANLVDSASGLVLSSVQVDTTNGNFEFAGIAYSNTKYFIHITTNMGSVGASAPLVSLSNGWAYVGESYGNDNASGTGVEPGLPNGIVRGHTITTHIRNIKVSLEEKPTTNNFTAASMLNPGGTARIQSPSLSGNDPEDGQKGQGAKYQIVSLPSNATLYYNNVAVTVNQLINNFDSTKLMVDPSFGTADTIIYDYKVLDSADVSSDLSGRIKIPVVGLSISGNIYRDGNGLNDALINGSSIGKTGNSKLYANLIDSTSGLVIASVAVDSASGSFDFAGIAAMNTGYEIHFSIYQGSVGSSPSMVALASDWAYVGESYGDNNGSGTGVEIGTPNGIVRGHTISTHIRNIKVGVEAKPSTNSFTAAAITNTGGSNKLQAPCFSGSDPEDGQKGSGAKYRITGLPSNATLYYNNIAVTANQLIVNFDSTLLSFDPTFNTKDTVIIDYIVLDSADIPSDVSGRIKIPVEGLSISGTIYRDANGLTDATINGSALGKIGINALYANLVDSATGLVEASVKVDSASGNFDFVGMAAMNTGYEIHFTINAGSVGGSPTAVSLSNNWAYVGESYGDNNASGTGIEIGTPNGIVRGHTISTHIRNMKVGVDEKPYSTGFTAANLTNLGGSNLVQSPSLKGTDAEDGIKGQGSPFKITSLPVNATLYYNSIAITLNQIINNFDSTKLQVDPTFVGSDTVRFKFRAIDSADVLSDLDGEIVMPMVGLSISGNVYHDINGLYDTLVNGYAIAKPSGYQLYANLVDSATGFVTSSVAVDTTYGTYDFAGVAAANTGYEIQISINPGTTGMSAPTVELPARWVYVGESYGDNNASGSGIEIGTPNGIVRGHTISTHIRNVKVGIEITPETDTLSFANRPNPGYTNLVQSPALRGTDSEEGMIGQGRNFKIIDLPSNGDLYYNGLAVSSNQVINAYDSALLEIDPGFNGADTITFTYNVFDSAGQLSAMPGLVRVPFYSLQISGTLYKDINGTTDSLINGSVMGKINTTQLYANIIDSVSNDVVGVASVNSITGIYSITQSINANTGYLVMISQIPGNIGYSAPSATLPAGWSYAGESYGLSNAIDSGIDWALTNGIVRGHTIRNNMTSVNFGVEPTAEAFNKSYSGINPNSFNVSSGNASYPYLINLNDSTGTSDGTVSGGSPAIMPGKVSGNDADEGNYSGLTGIENRRTFVLTSLPDSANEAMAYNGIILLANPAAGDPSVRYWNATASRFEINNFDADSLQIFVRKNGQTSLSFNYAWKDSAMLLGSPASYSIDAYGPLPFVLISSEAKWSGTDATVEWSMASEININQYEVERSIDGKQFEKIGSLAAHNNIANRYDYVYTDNGIRNQSNGLIYYRIKILELDNTYSYTKVMTLYDNKSAISNVMLYPNPSNSLIQIRIDISKAYTIKCIDLSGKTIIEKQGYKDLDIINISELPAGCYQMTIVTDAESLNIPFIKVN